MKYTIEEKKKIIKNISIVMVIMHLIYSILDITSAENIKEIIPFLGIYIVEIIVNIVIALQAKNYEKRKKLVILLGLLNLFSGIIVGLLEIFLLVVELSIDKGQTPKELPKLEMEYSSKPYRYVIWFVLVFLIFYTSLLEKLNINLDYNNWLPVLFAYSIQLLVIIIPFRKDLIKNFQSLKGNIGVYVKYALKMFGILMFFQFCINLFLQMIIGEPSTNESILETIPLGIKSILAVIIAPLTEEVLFRGYIRKIIKNDKIFIFVSGLLFGLLHIMYVEENLLMYLYGLVYMSMGWILAKTYTKTNNIFASITVHSFNNALAILAEILLKVMENM